MTLQKCPSANLERTRRHNEVVSEVVRLLRSKDYVVEVEPHVKHGNSFLKPDIVASKGEKYLVLDPIIAGDRADLSRYQNDKESKYKNDSIYSYVSSRSGLDLADAKQVTHVSGLVLDWRGCWSSESWNFLRRLGISSRMLEIISVRVLKRAWKMLRLSWASTA